MAAARRKGKWVGGLAPLGYDIDPGRATTQSERRRSLTRTSHLRALLEVGSFISTTQGDRPTRLAEQSSITRKGKERGGRHFDKSSLFKLLTNMAYVGKIDTRKRSTTGEHERSCRLSSDRCVQKSYSSTTAKTGGIAVRNKFGALLKGLVRFVYAATAPWTPNHTLRQFNKRYRYYVCSSAPKTRLAYLSV